jgi:hypothetical protein
MWILGAALRFLPLMARSQPSLAAEILFVRKQLAFYQERKINLPDAVLLTYPDSGHGSLFQFHESFTRQAAAFLASDFQFAPY